MFLRLPNTADSQSVGGIPPWAGRSNGNLVRYARDIACVRPEQPGRIPHMGREKSGMGSREALGEDVYTNYVLLRRSPQI